MTGIKLLDQYNESRQAIFEHVGYVEDWVVLPIDDRREMFWRLDGEGPGVVQYALVKENLPPGGTDKDGYENEIYTQRFLKKWVYRGPELTMVLVDTHTDGNRFLAIFENVREVTTK